MSDKPYKIKSPDVDTFVAVRQLLTERGVRTTAVSGGRLLVAGPDLPYDVAVEVGKLGARVVDDLQYAPEPPSSPQETFSEEDLRRNTYTAARSVELLRLAESDAANGVTGSFTRTLEVPATRVQEILATPTPYDVELAPTRWHGRYVLLGRNPVGTAPIWGTVAVDSVWLEQRGEASTTHCTLTVTTHTDPTMRPEHWTRENFQRQCDNAASRFGEQLVQQIAREADLTL